MLNNYVLARRTIERSEARIHFEIYLVTDPSKFFTVIATQNGPDTHVEAHIEPDSYKRMKPVFDAFKRDIEHFGQATAARFN